MNVNLDLVEAILKVFAVLPLEEPVEVAEDDVETMRHVLEYGCLPGEGEPAPVVIPGYPQDMIDASILILEEIGLLETAEIKAPDNAAVWRKPGGLTPLGYELLLDLIEPQAREKILAAFEAAGDVPYQQLIPVWYKGHQVAMREMKINKQISSLLLLVIVLMILSRLLR